MGEMFHVEHSVMTVPYRQTSCWQRRGSEGSGANKGSNAGIGRPRLPMERSQVGWKDCVAKPGAFALPRTLLTLGFAFAISR